ncbi:MAG: hypothetical protein Q3972_00930 [Corynebacterium sp.]|nr:hypothetical protein [Corynebacterium sp.]
MDLLPEQIGTATVAILGLFLVIILNVLGFDLGTSSFRGNGGSSDASSHAPVPTDAVIIRVGDTLMVNGIRIGQSISEIRTQIPDFPVEGTNVTQEDGWIRQAATYQDATYYFDGDGVLHRIAIKNTPENINYTSTYADAQATYGQPIYTFCSMSSTDAENPSVVLATGQCASYAVFNAYPANKLVWVMEYENTTGSTRQIRSIALDDGLDYYTAHATRAGQLS